MKHRVFQLSVSPEELPEVRRVIDFDGRTTLAEVHAQIRHCYGLEAGNPIYAFFMSGRFWDANGAYFDPRTSGERADRALLFRLGLKVGTSFAYLYDFGVELRFHVTVLAVRDATVPLVAPVLVESVGEAPTSPTPEGFEDEDDPPDIAHLVPLAEAFLDADDLLEPHESALNDARARAMPWEKERVAEGSELDESALPLNEEVLPLVREAATAAAALVTALNEQADTFLTLDDWLIERSLGPRLLDLPATLAALGEHETALRLARALVFIDRELMLGDLAVILAQAGRAPEALAQLDANLSEAKDAALVELKAGDTHRALGDWAAAEAYYRRSLELSQTPTARHDARLRVASCLMETGRWAEARQLLQQNERAEPGASQQAAAIATGVGRNDPCPCGSGRKYKKCHGQN